MSLAWVRSPRPQARKPPSGRCQREALTEGLLHQLLCHSEGASARGDPSPHITPPSPTQLLRLPGQHHLHPAIRLALVLLRPVQLLRRPHQRLQKPAQLLDLLQTALSVLQPFRSPLRRRLSASSPWPSNTAAASASPPPPGLAATVPSLRGCTPSEWTRRTPPPAADTYTSPPHIWPSPRPSSR